MGAARSVDRWGLVAERGVSPAVVVVCLPSFQSLITTRACASDLNMLMLRATRRVATPGAAARPAEGVEMLDVAMAEYGRRSPREPFSGLRPGELRRPNEWLGDVEK
jgi:hypothetical protein